MDPALIPFARRKSDEALVDTSEVPRGKACSCICPSCLSPLIARKGTKKVWHFAHTARANGDRTEELCEFSWAVSVRLMARQLLPSLGALCLPVAVFPLFTDGLALRQPEPTVTLAGPELLRLERVVIDATVHDVSVDALVESIDGRWCLFFEHGGRPEPESLGDLASQGFRCVIANLHGFASVLAKNSVGENHRTLLADFLVNDLESKRWAGHPDLDGARTEAKDARMGARRERPPPRAWELAMIERRRRDHPSLRAKYGLEEPEADAVARASNLPIFECTKCAHRASSRAITPRCPRCGLRMTQVEEAS